jgi:hypothetical protein
MPVLSKRLVDAAAPRAKEYQIFDGEIPGLALRIQPRGRKVYALFYRTGSGRKRTPSRCASPTWLWLLRRELIEISGSGGRRRT